jgi:uncharacterized membrane protein YdbT with pleckstrin-like domain
MTPSSMSERIIWRGYPSWLDHAFLFFLMGAASLRSAVALQEREWQTAGLYVIAVAVFFGIAAAFHYSVFYEISVQRIRIASGRRRRTIREIPLNRVQSVVVKRELLNRWLDVGALEITVRGEGDPVLLKGVVHPDRIKRQLEPRVGEPPTGSADL